MRPAVGQRTLVLRPPILHSWLSAAGPSRPRASPLKTDPWHPWYFGSSQGTRQKKRPFGILSVFFSGGTVALPLAFQDSHPNGVACGGEDASGPAHHRAGVERRGERHRLSHARLGKLGSMPPPPLSIAVLPRASRCIPSRSAEHALHPIAQRSLALGVAGNADGQLSLQTMAHGRVLYVPALPGFVRVANSRSCDALLLLLGSTRIGGQIHQCLLCRTRIVGQSRKERGRG